MRKRYPETTSVLIALTALGCFAAVTVLWHPGAYIIAGAVVLFILITAIRSDRRRR